MKITTDKNELKKYYSDQRLWQGIPGIEVTKNGRIFSAFYSGGCDEEMGNFVVLLKSDNGVDFSEPIAAVYKEKYRCYDECIWIDPLDRLWFIWSVMPDNAVYAAICDDPDADELVNPESKVKCIISKLGEYKGEEYDFKDKPRFGELVPYFAEGTNEETVERLFKYFYREIKPGLSRDEHYKLDELISELEYTNIAHSILIQLSYKLSYA